MLDLQRRLIAANYIYIPPQTPPLEKVGLVANSQFATFGVGKLGIVSILGILKITITAVKRLLWVVNRPGLCCIVSPAKQSKSCGDFSVCTHTTHTTSYRLQNCFAFCSISL